MTLDKMIDAVLLQKAEDGEPFTARAIAKIVGEDIHKVRQILQRRVDEGILRSKSRKSSDPNGMPVVIYCVRKRQVSRIAK